MPPIDWQEVESNPRFQGLSDEQKQRVRAYHDSVYGTAPSPSPAAQTEPGALSRMASDFARGAREYGGEALATAARGVRAVQAPFEEIAGQIEEAGPGMLKGAFGIPESVSGPPLRYVAGPAVRYIPLEAAAALTGGAAPMTEGAATAATRFGPAALRFLGRTARAGTKLGGYEAGTEGARQLAGETSPSAERVGESGAAGFVGGAGLHVALGEVGIPLAERVLGAGMRGVAGLRARLAPRTPAVRPEPAFLGGEAAAIPPAAPVAPAASPGVVPETTPVRPSAEAVRGGGEGTVAALRGGVEEGTTPGVPGAGEVQPAPGTAAPAIAVAPAPNNVLERAKLAADAEKGGQVAGAKPPDVYPKAPAEPQQGVLDVARQARAREMIGAPTEGAGVAEPPAVTPAAPPAPETPGPASIVELMQRAQAGDPEAQAQLAALRQQLEQARAAPPGPP